MDGIRHGRCEFADYEGKKHLVVWIVKLDWDIRTDKKMRIKNTDIVMLRIIIDDKPCAWFEEGKWKKRPPLFGADKNVYRMVLALYS